MWNQACEEFDLFIQLYCIAELLRNNIVDDVGLHLLRGGCVLLLNWLVAVIFQK